MPGAMPIQAEEVFEILVRDNTGMLLTCLRSVAWNPSTVDDLFHETMLVAWRRLSDYDQTRPFGAWLRGIAARLVLAHARKSKRDLMVCDERVLEYLDRQVERISQRDGDCWDEKLAALRECMAALPETHRQTISLRWQHLRAQKLDPATKGPKVVSIWYHPSTNVIGRIEFEQIHLQGRPEPRCMTISLVACQPLPDNWFEHGAHHPADTPVEYVDPRRLITY